MNYPFVTALHSSVYEHILTEMPEETLQSCFIGYYLDPDEEIVEVSDSGFIVIDRFRRSIIY